MSKFYYLLINIISLFVLISSENDNSNLKYLLFQFKRNLTLAKSFTPEEFYNKMFYNQIYLNIKVGSKQQEIPFYLYLRQYSFIIQSANAKKGEVKGKFNELESKTYKKIRTEEFKDNIDYDADELVEADVSEDIFHFSSNQNFIIPFYLSKENYGYSHITEGGKIGFDLTSHDIKNDTFSLVRYLKKKNLISSYNFSLIYDSDSLDCETGNFSIGALPHEFDKLQYNEDGHKTTYTTTNEWALTFEQILFGNEKIQLQIDAQLYPEFGFIMGNTKFFQILNNSGHWFEYFNITKKCHTYEFQIRDFESYEAYRFSVKYTGYYCDKDVDLDKLIPLNITFRSQYLGYNLTLNNNDVWIEKNGYKYFLILSSKSDEHDWIFGAPFFKKFPTTFNLDSKRIGIYTYINKYERKSEPENNLFIIYICIISGLVLLSGVLSFFLIRLYVYLPRKKRANELLDENFEYTPSETKQNEIIPDDENK